MTKNAALANDERSEQDKIYSATFFIFINHSKQRFDLEKKM
jgi:hypothetical protein